MLFYILVHFQLTTPRKLAQPSPPDHPSTSTWPMCPTTAVPRTSTRNSSRECELRTMWWAGTTQAAENLAAESWTPCWRAKLSGVPIYRYFYYTLSTFKCWIWRMSSLTNYTVAPYNTVIRAVSIFSYNSILEFVCSCIIIIYGQPLFPFTSSLLILFPCVPVRWLWSQPTTQRWPGTGTSRPTRGSRTWTSWFWPPAAP